MNEQDLFKTEKRKVKDLLPYQFNPRKMQEDQVDSLKKSLQKFGLVELPVVDADGTIVAGHQRLKVMVMIGRGDDTIEVRVAKRKLTDEEFQFYNVASNKITGEWDWDMLSNNFDIDLLKDIGFSETDLLGKEAKKPEGLGPINDSDVESGTDILKQTELCALFLIKQLCLETNAEKATITQEVTFQDKAIGTYKLTVEKV